MLETEAHGSVHGCRRGLHCCMSPCKAGLLRWAVAAAAHGIVMQAHARYDCQECSWHPLGICQVRFLFMAGWTVLHVHVGMTHACWYFHAWWYVDAWWYFQVLHMHVARHYSPQYRGSSDQWRTIYGWCDNPPNHPQQESAKAMNPGPFLQITPDGTRCWLSRVMMLIKCMHMARPAWNRALKPFSLPGDLTVTWHFAAQVS